MSPPSASGTRRKHPASSTTTTTTAADEPTAARAAASKTPLSPSSPLSPPTPTPLDPPSSSIANASSSSSNGFFQEAPVLRNQFYDDECLHRMFEFYLPQAHQTALTNPLQTFAHHVTTPSVLAHTADAERNAPHLRTWDTFGRRRDEIITSEGWRRLQDLGVQEGMVGIAYGERARLGAYARVYQFLKYHLWTGTAAFVICPSAMTDGAASLLSRQLRDESLSADTRAALESAYARLTSRVPGEYWTSGQWMTERQGGSDVSQTETIAIPLSAAQRDDKIGIDGSALGDWSISGFKWFSSATDGDMSVLLAKTPDGGLSTFFAPMKRTLPGTHVTELNGISIQRLKNKLGTKALPTAELVLNGTRAHLIGAQGQGVREIATVLNITRVHTAVGALGSWGRGLAISRAYAHVRVVGGKRLIDIPAHVHSLAENEVEYRGYMHLTFFTILLLGISEEHTGAVPKIAGESSLKRVIPSHKDAGLLLRVLTPVIKALASKAAVLGLRECMESLGGIGYLENEDIELNIARLFRDASVLSIWEGTADVLASDLVRVLKGNQAKDVMHALNKWKNRTRIQHAGLSDRFAAWRRKIENDGAEKLRLDGREVMLELGKIVGGHLLLIDAEIKPGDVVQEFADRWNGDKHENERNIEVQIDIERRLVGGEQSAHLKPKM